MNKIDFSQVENIFDFKTNKLFSTNEKIEKVISSKAKNGFSSFHISEENAKNSLEAFFESEYNIDNLTLEEKGFYEYLNNLVSRKKDVLDFFKEIKKIQKKLFIDSIKYAKEYLPENASIDYFQLVFIPLPYNAFFDNGVIYNDPLLALDMDISELEMMLAHQMHHFGRYSIRNPIVLDSEEINDVLLDKFILLEVEGIANKVGDARNISKMKKLKKFREQADKDFEKYLALLQEIYLGIKEKTLTENDLDAFKNQRGLLNTFLMPVGFKMADLIESNLGREELVKTVGNPLDFLKKYQMVANKKNLFLFESKTFVYLKEDLCKL